MVLKRPCVGDAGRPLHIHSGLSGDSSLSNYGRVTEKMVLIKGIKGSLCTFIHVSQETELVELI